MLLPGVAIMITSVETAKESSEALRPEMGHCVQCWERLIWDGKGKSPNSCPKHKGPTRYNGFCRLPNPPLERVCSRNSSVQALLNVEPIIRACSDREVKVGPGVSQKRVMARKQFLGIALCGLLDSGSPDSLVAELGTTVEGECLKEDLGPGSIGLSKLERNPDEDVDVQEYLSRLLEVLVGDTMSLDIFGTQVSCPLECTVCGRCVFA